MTTTPSRGAASAGASYCSASADIGGCLSVGGLHSQPPSRRLGAAIGDPPKPTPIFGYGVFRDRERPTTVDGMAARAKLPTGTVTFLFSDIEGSTRLLKALGRERYGEILRRHNEILRNAFLAHEGVEIDRQGDAFFFVF